MTDLDDVYTNSRVFGTVTEDGKRELNIPIVAFPPFKLRSSLIDKDPVIFVHVLEYYIDLFRKLIMLTDRKKNPDVKLSVKSNQQLTTFMRGYLYEVSEETSRIFSLGAINPDIVSNQKLLKIVIFQFIKGYNLVNLKLTGESVWHFVKIYVRLAYENQSLNQSLINLSIVRNLIKGTIKSKMSSKSDDLSMIKMVHDHLNTLISSTKFNISDLETLSMLLGQKMKQNTRNSNNKKTDRKVNIVNKNNKKNNNNSDSSANSDFAEEFVNTYWVGKLETLYNDGNSLHSKKCFEIMLVSLLSLPSHKIAKLLTSGLQINNKTQLIKLHPLIAKIILSLKFSDMNPDIHEKIPFLNKTKTIKPASGREGSPSTAPQFDEEKVRMVNDLFPQLSQGQVKQLLFKHDNNVDRITNMLLESPEIMESLEEFKAPKRKIKSDGKVSLGKVTKTTERTFYKGEPLDFSTGSFGNSKKDISSEVQKPDSGLKAWNLTRALQILNPEDDDEPDDTYADQEKTTGAATESALSRKQRRQQKKSESGDKSKSTEGDNEADTIDDEGEGRDDIDDAEVEEKNAQIEMQLEKIELMLFDIYRKNMRDLTRDARNTESRKKLKDQTHWTDEQIEGWARMVQKNPKRIQFLEDKMLTEFDGPLNAPGYKKEHDSRKPSKFKSNVSASEETKRQQARKNKNKSSKANHNRKSGHDKKMAKQFN